MEKNFVIKNGKLMQYTGEDKIVRIPDGVKSISWGFLKDNKNRWNIEEVIIPEGVTELPEGSFFYYDALKKVVLPNGLIRIKERAFMDCKQIEELIIPDSVSIIDSNAFAGCSGIRKIRITDSLQKIVKNAFYSFYYYGDKEADWFVREWEIEIRSVSNSELSRKQLIAALRYDNLAYTFLRGKLTANEDYINYITKWLGSKANRKIIVDAAIKRNNQQVIDELFKLGFKFTSAEIDDYIKAANEAGRTELSAVILAGVNSSKEYKKKNKKEAENSKSVKPQLNDQQKVSLLETAVMNNDIEGVKAILTEHSPIPFTARAIGLACRFIGPEMVNTLLEHGATLDYFYSPAMKRFYDCAIEINNHEDLKYDYSLYLFPEEEVTAYENTIIPASERADVIEVLYNKNAVDCKELLYYSILYNDEALMGKLKQLDVCRLSEFRIDIVSGRISYTSLSKVGRYHKDEFLRYCYPRNNKNLLIMLNNFLMCMDIDRIVFRASYYYTYEKTFITEFCSEKLFDFYIHNTDMMERVKKMELLCALVDKNNKAGMQYAINEKWVKKAQDLEDLLYYARKAQGTDNGLIACIDGALKKLSPDKKVPGNSEAGDTGTKTMSAAELKKIWGTKTLPDGTILITSYKGSEPDVVIPSMIGKAEVTAIDPEAFSSMASRITEVQKRNRRNITSVEFPGSIKEIPKHIFYEGYSIDGRNKLKKIIINEGTIRICEKAFKDCSSIEEIIIPDSVVEIGDSAFSGCKRLKKIRLSQNIDTFANNIFNNTGFTEFDIPETITTIGWGVFSGCHNLNSVTMPKTITKIPSSSFSGCSSLSFVSLPEKIEEIENYAFSGCDLETFYVPETVRIIGPYAFSNCRNLKKITIPVNAVIGDDAFYGCMGLADDNGQVIINNCLCGIADRNTLYEISDDFAITPLVLGDEVKTIATSLWNIPIVYRKHAETGQKIDVEKLAIGDDVMFGRFPDARDYIVKPLSWRVIAVQDNKALLITNYCIMNQFGLGQRGRWADCYIRKMLNEGFYNSAFTKTEQEQIVMETLVNPGNKQYHVIDGQNTNDKVFLLSYEEVNQFMPETKDREVKITEYARTGDVTFYDCWMMRTTGKDDARSAASVSTYGNYKMSGNNRIGYCYLRPAVWIK